MQNEVNNMITNEREWVKIPLLSNKVGKRSGTMVTTVSYAMPGGYESSYFILFYA